MMSATHVELSRGTVPHPADPGRAVAFFRSWQLAIEHLANHVLTAPECEAWAIVMPGLTAHVAPDDGPARLRYAEQAQQSHGASAQGLFDLYRGEADSAACQAHALGWHTSHGNVCVALGPTGVFVLIEADLLITVYLPGQGSAGAVHAGLADRPGPLPRERRLMRRDRAHREDRRRRQREEGWSAEERLYYRVFRPAVQFIRSRYHQSHDLAGRVRRDDALLKSCLPTMSRLDFEGWQKYRLQASAGGTA